MQYLLEEINCWEAFDLKSFTKLWVLSHIDLSKEHVLSFKDCCSSCPLWCQCFTMTAPGSIEFNRDVLILSNDLIKVIIIHDDNIVFCTIITLLVSLVLKPFNDSISIAATLVIINLFTILEVKDSWETFNLVFFSQKGVSVTVDFS